MLDKLERRPLEEVKFEKYFFYQLETGVYHMKMESKPDFSLHQPGHHPSYFQITVGT